MIAALERMSIEEISEIRDRLKSGRARVELVASATLSTETARWLEEAHAAMIEAYAVMTMETLFITLLVVSAFGAALLTWTHR